MKNTNFSRKNKFEKLSPELARFIESMGLYLKARASRALALRVRHDIEIDCRLEARRAT